MAIDLIDVRRAYFHAKSRREIYVELCDEDAGEGMCGLFNQCMGLEMRPRIVNSSMRDF